MTGPPDPSYLGIAYAALPLLGCTLILAVRRLGQVRPMLIAMARLCAQLALLATLLRWVFAHQGPGIVLAVGLGMLIVSAHTVAGRLDGPRWALRGEAFLSMAVSLVLVMGVALKLGLRLEPWYQAQTVIPLLGMVLGNSVSGVSLAIERFLGEVRADRDRIELRLALGATSRQAAMPALRAAVRAAPNADDQQHDDRRHRRHPRHVDRPDPRRDRRGRRLPLSGAHLLRDHRNGRPQHAPIASDPPP